VGAESNVVNAAVKKFNKYNINVRSRRGSGNAHFISIRQVSIFSILILIN